MKKLAIVLILIPSFAFAGEDIFASMREKLSYLNKRHAVISNNISNADTPRYKAYDVEQPGLGKQGSSRIKLRTTDPSHISKRSSGNKFRKVRDNTYETAPNGNNVILEEQMIKMAENDLEHKATLGVMKQMTGLLRAAIGDQR